MFADLNGLKELGLIAIVKRPAHDPSDYSLEPIELSQYTSPGPGSVPVIGDRFGVCPHAVQDIQLKPGRSMGITIRFIYVDLGHEVPNVRSTGVPATEGPEIDN